MPFKSRYQKDPKAIKSLWKVANIFGKVLRFQMTADEKQ